MTLHKFSISPYGSKVLTQTAQRLQPDDKIILLEDAVYSASDKALADKLAKFCPIYCIQDDLTARGLTISHPAFRAISYVEFVELTLTCKQVISW